MRVKMGLILFITFLLLVGCNSDASGKNTVPDDMSKEYYDDFVKSYELYEERAQEHNGSFVDDNGNEIDFDDLFIDEDLIRLGVESDNKIDRGEEPILNETELQLVNDIISLYWLKGNDESSIEFAMRDHFDSETPEEHAIKLEERVIDILELDKDSITAELQ
ncbi:hypothetical protein [Oceanobacillus jeddahense]|uniref:Uncharacterized protein n=1 Tax=Oceanobacillus jeddahense TaxID=1462527 RepID=A0ABY5JN50_9BACI|nr:hypothetical protein [Oceanobacillus jeddahense]UUI01730.1 hypothetical protein NP439_16970 [Oceanobacillus jeddahense]